MKTLFGDIRQNTTCHGQFFKRHRSNRGRDRHATDAGDQLAKRESNHLNISCLKKEPNMPVPTNGPSPSYTSVGSRLRKSYRGGFRSSICDLFADPARRSDCCSIACCGVLQSDRNRYLFNGERPSWWMRITVNFILPTGFVFIVIFASLPLFRDESPEAAAAWLGRIMLVSILAAIAFVSLRGCFIRMKFRREVMNRIHEERSDDVSISRDITGDLRFANLPCCGCYSNDVIFTLDDSNNEYDDQGSPQADFCTRLFQSIASLCCGVCCLCWCQFCGMCAIGQEEREISALVPKEKQMIDYITFEVCIMGEAVDVLAEHSLTIHTFRFNLLRQPFLEYYPRIVELRQNMTESFWTHIQAVSKLSRNLLITFGAVLLLLTVLALTRVDKQFQFINLLILIATLCQAFFILYFVHWRWHRFDLSFDAVVKLFSSGFILGTTQALIFEWIVQCLWSIIFGIVVIFDLVAEMPPNASSDDLTKWLTAWLHSHVWLFSIAVFVNAYVVAALIEELCKYFSFWMVEHPDYLEEEDCNAITTDNSALEEPQLNVNGRKGAQKDAKTMAESAKNRTLKSKGSAITIAMVTASLGFACCENLMYVFNGTPGASIGMGE